MIQIVEESRASFLVCFTTGKNDLYESGKLTVKVGKDAAEFEKLDRNKVKEIAARAGKLLEQYEIKAAKIDISFFMERFEPDIVREITEGLLLATYHQITYKEQKAEKSIEVSFIGIPKVAMKMVLQYIKETETISKGILFARDMVNLPGNKLKPEEFAAQIQLLLKDTSVEVEVFHEQQLREMGMRGLLGIGESSENKPCLLVMRYLPLGEETDTTALVGKGVTCDTGGYCLKPAKSMLGIKGDMAGGAAVAGAVYALAQNGIRTNVIGVIPMCENRISNGSLLPGDVITSYDGTTIEVLNTDAEGRVILADAVSFAVSQKNVKAVLDVATLTGAVVNLLGFSIGGVISDDDGLYESFEKGIAVSGERYLRIPFYEEHEKMIESKIADVKNMGESFCGTITAGLFIRKFARKIPWIHLDIAGTAWVDTPVFDYQSTGATGAALSSIYQMCVNRGEV